MVKEELMLEVELIGTGGQGSVIAADLLTDAAVKAGCYAQTFSIYGAARRGGRVESSVRISEEPILLHSRVYEPDFLVMVDEAEFAQPTDGRFSGTHIKKGSTVLINTSKPKSAFSSLKDCNVFTLDAYKIAVAKGLALPSGQTIINTTLLGAIVGLIPTVGIDHLIETLRDSKIPAKDKNIEAAQEAYQRISQPVEAPVEERVTVVEIEKAAEQRFPQYRNRLSPCEASCPAGEIIERTISFIQDGHFEEALESIKAENPFPGICGRVCFHPCEVSCNRIQYDEGIATNALERAAFDYADASLVRKPEKRPSTGKRVAVTGSGPAGLTCAYYLALLGHSVTVFEAQPVAGGVPRFGIPEYRLPKKIVEQEIKEIADLGVDIKVNAKVGKDIAFDTMTKEYDACFIAAGAHRSMELGIPGEDSSGVLSGLDFLKRASFGEKVDVGTRVAVIGGGNTAVDSARTAKRLGASEVAIVYRRSAEEMPAYEEEVAAAEKEGIKIHYLAMPVQIHSGGSRVSRLECIKARLGGKDESGRRRPEPIEGSNFMIDIDTVITALGEALELPFTDGTLKMSGPVIEVDELGRTSLAGVYAGGDVTSVSRSVAEAIGSGKRAALGIELFLTSGDEKAAISFRKGDSGAISMSRYLNSDYTGDTGDSNGVVSYEDLNVAYFTEEPRIVTAELPAETRIRGFAETKLGFTREDAIAEAKRCFHCGHCTMCELCYILCPDIAISLDSDSCSFIVNTDFCKACGICIRECPRDAISR